MTRATIFAFLIAMTGCGSGGPHVVPVEGTATRHGQPVANLFINFMPQSTGATGRPSWGQTDADGKFVLNYEPGRDGAEVGPHRVSVKFRAASPKEEVEIVAGRKKFHPDQKAIMDKYGNVDTSPLLIEVKSGGGPIRLELD